ALKKPHDAAAQAVQDAYQPTIKLLAEAVNKAKTMINGWRDHKRELQRQEEAKRAVEAQEAQRREEEARKAKEAAEAKGDGAGALQAELDMLNAQDEAARAAAAPTIRPEGIVRTQAGSAGARTIKVPVIINMRTVLTFLAKNHMPALTEAISPVVARLTR